jgi:hypothetical protein
MVDRPITVLELFERLQREKEALALAEDGRPRLSLVPPLPEEKPNRGWWRVLRTYR